MSVLHRRKAVFARGNDAVVVPKWRELAKMNSEQIEALAGKLGIEFTTFSATKSAINKAR